MIKRLMYHDEYLTCGSNPIFHPRDQWQSANYRFCSALSAMEDSWIIATSWLLCRKHHNSNCLKFVIVISNVIHFPVLSIIITCSLGTDFQFIEIINPLQSNSQGQMVANQTFLPHTTPKTLSVINSSIAQNEVNNFISFTLDAAWHDTLPLLPGQR